MLRIESIETIPISVALPFSFKGSTYQMRNRCTIVTRVRMGDGIVGECYNGDEEEEAQRAVRSIIDDEIAGRLVGLDAFQVERAWETMLPVTFDQLRPRWYAMQAIACVDSAIWDGIGKALEQPLWRLWGGYRSTVPVIGIGGYYLPDSSEAKNQSIEHEIDFFRGELGLCGMKFKVGGRSPREDTARLMRARDQAGDGFEFVVDANQGYTVGEALDLVRTARTEGIEFLWFEEPTRWHADFRGLRDVRLRGNVNVAAGQSEISRVGMREMMVAGAIDVSNFDASWGGGPSEWRRVAAVAAVFDVSMAHHEEAQIATHLIASQAHGRYVEVFSPTRDPIFWNLIANRPPIADGHITLSERPGYGWDLDESFITKYRLDR